MQLPLNQHQPPAPGKGGLLRCTLAAPSPSSHGAGWALQGRQPSRDQLPHILPPRQGSWLGEGAWGYTSFLCPSRGWPSPRTMSQDSLVPAHQCGRGAGQRAPTRSRLCQDSTTAPQAQPRSVLPPASPPGSSAQQAASGGAAPGEGGALIWQNWDVQSLSPSPTKSKPLALSSSGSTAQGEPQRGGPEVDSRSASRQDIAGGGGWQCTHVQS